MTMGGRLIKSDVLELLRSRRSLRRYQSEPIPEAIIRQILESGLWAPSAHNRQPWRFAVLTSLEARTELAQAMGARLRRDLEADQVPEHIIAADVARSHDRLTSAPVVIVVCLSMRDMDRYTDAKRNEHERTMAVQSVAMAGQNILLAAHGLGLGACWMCAPLFCPEVVQTTVDLDADWEPQGLITMGYPAQEREKTREPLESRMTWR